MAKQSNPDFHIILESSVVFAGGSRYLLNHPLSAAIKALSEVRDVRVFWYLPEAVLLEREYQMVSAAEALLNDFRAVEKILAVNFKVSKDDIVHAVREVIKQGIARHSLTVLKLESSQVDWDSIIRSAIFRHAPFQVGDKEKGFRDAVIIETFCQQAASLYKDPNNKIVFLANDDLAVAASKERVKEFGDRVTVVRNLTELSSAINGIPAHLSSAEISDILVKATALFYRAGDRETFYYSANLDKIIRETFAADLAKEPENVSINAPIEFVTTDIGMPTFLEKNAKLLHFSTIVGFHYRVGASVANTAWVTSTPSAGTSITSAGTGSVIGTVGGSPLSGAITGPFSMGGGGSTIPYSVGGGGTAITGPFSMGGGTGANSIFVSTSPASNGANTSFTISTDFRRTFSFQFAVRWCATLTAEGQLSEPKIQNIERLPTD
ncbi:DUF4935 domain-containing protein [Bradyrhizobium sp. AUGA SZCCT0176]|uniref:PIN domain-containing protein n=1 Tax=Bradyrhizobium sp. AUGA SZCCT0176 TaxID=2807664 RepID=UPI001BAD6438|nr:PIN domain-containing protein [Bradyrhizobium sp. AUGA SZCCT0176]MBR1229501.1 DUF4935 domain-containing protein [Bradyrhizobium sp. AUGA SZCCT0176]